MGTHMDINVGSHVWVEDPSLAWIDGEVSNVSGKDVEVHTSNGKTVVTNLSKIYPKDMEAPAGGLDDMTKLSYLHEPAVLQNLSTRYELGEIYNVILDGIQTYTGSILIAINPFQRLHHLYDTLAMERYKGSPIGKLSPHVFAVADSAYRAMINEGKSNSILISGESGAGKTETAKMVMQYLAYLGGRIPTEGRTVEQKVLESNPLLEAFGNAKTVRNDNSSRFGKFVEIQFDKHGRISGAAVRTYLLERSRVCQISDSERNYHCFYLLCAAPPSEIEKFKLGNPESFHYLNQSNCYELVDVGDAHDYLATRKAMDIVGITEKEQDSVFKVIAAILHLGNIEFDKGRENDSSVLKNEMSKFHLQMTAELLMCDPHALKDALCQRVMITRGEVIKRCLDPLGATVSRDGLAKAIYSHLFDWLVAKINISIGQGPDSNSLIGVLDIYGFESFETNSFEQFCINFTNEKLQQHFNQYVFKTEQEEYTKEEIDWSYVEFVDNQDVLDLIEKKPGGIIALLDEACMFPKSTHGTFCEKLYQTFKGHKRFIKPKLSSTNFTIAHFAGEVLYKADQFLEKNKDYVVPEHQKLLCASKCSFVAGLFPSSTNESTKISKFSSIASRFKLQLQQLIETLISTEPHYIRCVKPSNLLKPGMFDNVSTMQQLRCSGVLDAIRINCAGYPSRRTFNEFLKRYGFLSPEILEGHYDERVACTRILEQKGLAGFQIGKSKVFLRADQAAELDAWRTGVLSNKARTIQRKIRTHNARKEFAQLRKATIVIQTLYRRRLACKLFEDRKKEEAIIKIQKNSRRFLAQNSYAQYQLSFIFLQRDLRTLVGPNEYNECKHKRKIEAATIIQAQWRCYRALSDYKKLKMAVIVCQRRGRGRLARRELKKLKLASREFTWQLQLEKQLRASREFGELKDENDMLQKQVDELTWQLQLEKQLRASGEFIELKDENEMLQKQVDELTWQLQLEKQLKTELEETTGQEIIKLQISLQVMQNKFGEINKMLLKEREAEQKTSEGTLHPINRISVPNGDAQHIAFLTEEVEGLKNLLESEKQKVLEFEKICKEAQECNEKRHAKLEATEGKVDQLQETLGRMIQYFSNEVSELIMILGTSSSSISTTRPNGLYDQVDAISSGTGATFPNPVPSPFTISSLAPDALRQILLDLSPPAKGSGPTNMESSREGAFDDFF